MKSLLPALASTVAGLAIGAAAYRAMKPTDVPVKTMAPAKIERAEVSEATLLPSGDTLEILRDPNLSDRAGRIALWLPHAGLDEVVKLWEHLSASPPIPEPLGKLVLSRWVMLDPQAAMASGKNPNDFSAWEAWASIDPRAAEAAARASGKRMAVWRVLAAISGLDPDYVAKLLEEDLSGANIVLPKLVEGFIAQRRFDKALDSVLRLGGNYNHKLTVLQEWAKEDLEQVLLWGAQNPHHFLKGENDEMVNGITRDKAEKIPEILAKMPTSDIKARVERAYMLELAEKDTAKAIRFAEGVASPLARNSMLGELGRKYAASNPNVAAEILGKMLDHDAPLGEYPVAVFFAEGERGGWHSTDSPACGFAEDLITRMPELAMDAVMAGSGKPAYDHAARQLAEDWMERDRWDFGTWLAGQPVGKLRDELVETFSSSLIHEGEPAYPEALNWASSMGDAGTRDELVDQFLRRWGSDDPDALRVYLAAPGTPEIARSRAKKLAQ
ncbi:hypothetical protein OJ996_00620 [Luteolibacter sp. GHJ8]|uniref:Uncharacterized protein n=1 Tax=Luteolibacter rhizosphaerae TaxID=2989719 RepID=A0ABT3FWW9_9BACT|nr:hypothetical protein [Luteolibacter rhizosphaerae]MCW1912057.1 hypothetical protein [Luteolibacter rhizosphaerae]